MKGPSYIFLCWVFLLNGCSSPPEPRQPEKPQKPEPATYTVEIKDMKFVPDSIVVKKGDDVIFVNRDIVNHCVTGDDSAWTSGPIPGGEDWMLVAQKSSTYYCAIHRVMKGKIIVKDSIAP
jgi:plastocyanin